MEKYRQQLNDIDNEMRKLFELRLDIVKEIGKFKKDNNLEIYDEVREQYIINKGLSNLENDMYESYYKLFLQNLMEISKDLQQVIFSED